jgi:hypothetical protein
MQLRWGLRTITGDYRDNNEDRALADERGRFFIIATGWADRLRAKKPAK